MTSPNIISGLAFWIDRDRPPLDQLEPALRAACNDADRLPAAMSALWIEHSTVEALTKQNIAVRQAFIELREAVAEFLRLHQEVTTLSAGPWTDDQWDTFHKAYMDRERAQVRLCALVDFKQEQSR